MVVRNNGLDEEPTEFICHLQPTDTACAVAVIEHIIHIVRGSSISRRRGIAVDDRRSIDLAGVLDTIGDPMLQPASGTTKDLGASSTV